MGGILQGINPITFNTIRSQGGWIRLRVLSGRPSSTPTPVTRSTIRSTRTWRPANGKYNQQVFANVIYDITKQWLVGVEVSSWKTLYVNKRPGEGVRFDFQTRYSF